MHFADHAAEEEEERTAMREISYGEKFAPLQQLNENLCLENRTAYCAISTRSCSHGGRAYNLLTHTHTHKLFFFPPPSLSGSLFRYL
jgi:hypothetical protein